MNAHRSVWGFVLSTVKYNLAQFARLGLIDMSGRHPQVLMPFSLRYVISCVLFDFGLAVVNGCHPWLSSVVS